LVVVAKNEDSVTECGLRGARPRDKIRVAGQWQIAGALDAALRAGVRASAEQEQRGCGAGWFDPGGHGFIVTQAPPAGVVTNVAVASVAIDGTADVAVAACDLPAGR
jgi:hypothetical protein